jgi:hypothetical protein
VDENDVFPARAGFPPGVRDVADVRSDVTSIRLTAKAQNLARLQECHRLERLWCFDVNAKSAPIIGSLTALRRLYVDEMRLETLSWLNRLERLEVLSLEGCTRITSLDELAPFRAVSALALTHFPKVRSLEPLRGFGSLEALVVAGGMWSRMTVDTLEPLSKLNGLRFLHLSNLKAHDESLGPLADLTRLETLELPNFYSIEQVARLSARLPNTACAWFAPYRSVRHGQCPRCKQATMVMLTGKGASTLCGSCDADRVRAHEALFRSIAAGV